MPQPPSFDAVADAEVKRAFRGGAPRSTALLRAGTKLYKWSKSPYGRAGVSPWWFFLDKASVPPGVPCETLQERLERAGRLGASDRDFHRARGAVSEQWNSMPKPIAIRLTRPAWGYIGQASGQLKDQTVPGVVLIGGDWQVWVPGLKASSITQISILPYLTPR